MRRIRSRAVDRPGHRRAGAPRFADTDPYDWVGGTLPWHYPVHGVDISKYQGDIDWHRDPRLRRRLRLHQGDRGRRPHRRPLPAELGTAGLRRRACRAAPTTSTTSAAHPGRAGGLVHRATCRATARRCRRCSTSSGTTSRGPAAASPTPPPCAPRPGDFLQLLTGYYGKRPLIYTTVDFYRDNELWKLDGHHFWLRSVAGHPSEGLSRAGLGLLAVYRHRRRCRHRGPDRPQRLRRRSRAMGRLGDRRPELARSPRRRSVAALSWARASGEGIMVLRVIETGFGRTGTDSMREAVNILGFGPCHHMYPRSTTTPSRSGSGGRSPRARRRTGSGCSPATPPASTSLGLLLARTARGLPRGQGDPDLARGRRVVDELRAQHRRGDARRRRANSLGATLIARPAVRRPAARPRACRRHLRGARRRGPGDGAARAACSCTGSATAGSPLRPPRRPGPGVFPTRGATPPPSSRPISARLRGATNWRGGTRERSASTKLATGVKRRIIED